MHSISFDIIWKYFSLLIVDLIEKMSNSGWWESFRMFTKDK